MVSNSLSNRKNSNTNFSTFMTGPAIVRKVNEMVGGRNGQRFITSIISYVGNNSALQVCNYSSIVSAAMLGEALKLSPSPQLAYYYMVPFKVKGEMVAQFVLGYKGYIQLAIRSGQYKHINVIAVKEGELVKYNPFTEEIEVNAIEDPLERENAKTIGYYAFFELTNGFTKAMYWSKEKMEAHALKYSKGYQAKKGYTFWEKDFDAMAYKTMLRQLISKWGIMSIDMQNAIDADMSVVNDDGTKEYVDSPNFEPAEEVKPHEIEEASTSESAEEMIFDEEMAFDPMA